MYDNSNSSVSTQENFTKMEDWIVHYKSETINMTSVSNISNPYAGEIDLSRQFGLSLYQEAKKVFQKKRSMDLTKTSLQNSRTKWIKETKNTLGV